jgi:hypothetical protein
MARPSYARQLAWSSQTSGLGCERAFPNDALHVWQPQYPWEERALAQETPQRPLPFHPDPASWLNQIETWFSILQGQSLSGAWFTAVEQLQKHIDAFIAAYNETAQPFAWTKKKVRQRRFKKSPYHTTLIPGY